MQVQLIDALRYHQLNTTMPTEAKLTKKRSAPAKKLCRNIIEKQKCPLDSRRLEVKDSEICGMALFVTRAGARSWYLTRKINGRLIRKNLGKRPVVSPEAAGKKVIPWLQGNDSEDSAPECRKGSQDDMPDQSWRQSGKPSQRRSIERRERNDR